MVQDPMNLLWMNQLLVESTTSSDTQFGQYPSCLPLTGLRVNTTEADFRIRTLRSFFQTSSVTFFANVTIDVSEYEILYENAISVIRSRQLQLWFRIMKCLASEVGYCQPFLDSESWNEYFDNTTTAKDFRYEPGAVLPMMPTSLHNNDTYTTQWIAVSLERVGNSSLYEAQMNVTAQVIELSESGIHNFIGHGTILLPLGRNPDLNESALRIDLSQFMGLFGIHEAPRISTIGVGTKIYVGVLSFITGSMTLAMLCLIVKHRNHKVMTMAQAGLLGWLCASTLVVIMFSFLIMPTNDVFCKANNLLFIPGTIIPAILVGRLWRAYTALSVANRLGRDLSSNDDGSNDSPSKSTIRRKLCATNHRTEERVMKWLRWIAFSRVLHRHRKPQRRSSALRQTTTRRDTVRLILVLCLPQIVIQLFNTFYTDYHVGIVFSQDHQRGRQACISQFGVDWALYIGVAFLTLMHLLACYVAYCSRALPSAFNEKDQVFTSTMINVVVSVCLVGLLTFFDIGEADPNVSTCISATLIVAISIITSLYVVTPKLKRVWSGDEVVVTNVLRDMTGAEQRQGVSIAGTVESRLQTFAPFHRTSTACETGEPVVRFLKPSEAIPRRMEHHIYELEEIITKLSREAAEGRPVQKELWIAFTEANSVMARDIQTHPFLWRNNVEENGNGGGNDDEEASNHESSACMLEGMASTVEGPSEEQPKIPDGVQKHVSMKEDL
jgi:hypothetical protein